MFLITPDRRINWPWALAIVFGIGFMALAYLNYFQYSKNQQATNQLNDQITDLTYQVNQDHKAGLGLTATPSPSVQPTPTPDPSVSPSVTPTPTPSPAGSAYPQGATIKTRYNVHATASALSAVKLPYTSEQVGEQATLNAAPSGGWENVTVGGVTGYINSDAF